MGVTTEVACLLLASAFWSCEAASRSPTLDGPGRAMLDPSRREALPPAALIERLGLRPDSVVADVGAGPGFFTLELASAVPHGHVLATDIRPDYLAVLEARAHAAHARNVRTLLVRPDTSGLEPGSFDLIWLCQVDHYLRDRTAYLAELGAALRPQGRIAVVNYLRFREANRAAARSASLEEVDAWNPSPSFFLLVLRPRTPQAPPQRSGEGQHRFNLQEIR